MLQIKTVRLNRLEEEDELYFMNSVRQYLRDQNGDEENQQPIVTTVNEIQSANSEMVPLEKYKLEVEQRVREKYGAEMIIVDVFCRNISTIFYDIVIENYNN